MTNTPTQEQPTETSERLEIVNQPTNLQWWAEVTAKILEETNREGADFDHPEGARWVKLSETLAIKLARNLREAIQHETTQR